MKSPKVYIADTGILHTLLGLDTKPELEGHPQAGFSADTFPLAERIRAVAVDRLWEDVEPL